MTVEANVCVFQEHLFMNMKRLDKDMRMAALADLAHDLNRLALEWSDEEELE